MLDKNEVLLVGRLTKAPEIKNTKSGKEVATFSIVTNKGIKNKDTGVYEDNPTFHNCVMFSNWQIDQVLKKVGKGMRMIVRGEIKVEEYEGKRYTKIIAYDVNAVFDFRKDENGVDDSYNNSQSVANDRMKDISGADDDIPL